MASKKKKKKQKKQRAELPVIGKNGGSAVAGSKMGKWRALVLLGVNVLIALHIIQWLAMGTTVSPIEPSEAMYTLRDGAVNAGFIFFGLELLATLIFGRFICGWACHVLALQDGCAWIMKKLGIKPMAFKSRLLVFVPLIFAIYMFIWPIIHRQLTRPPEAPLIPPFTNDLITTDFWATFPSVWVAIPFLFVCGFMTVWFLGSKGFCTYACPYGGFFAELDKFSKRRIRVNDDCQQSGHCTITCTSNVEVSKEVNTYGMVVDPGCMKCMDCISGCPNDALYYGKGESAFSVEKTIKPKYTMSWPEEIGVALLFFASLFAVWNVYQLVPMLMALGIAAVSAFLGFILWRLLTKSVVTFHRMRLKVDGKPRLGGIILGLFALAWLTGIGHSGYVRYFESAGNASFNRIVLPDELILASENPKEWLSSEQIEDAEYGRRSFERATNAGLFDNAFALPKFAWLEYLGGNRKSAIDRLQQAADVQTGRDKALSLYYRGMMLNRDGRHDEAIKSFDAAIDERPDLSAALEAKGESLWKLGRKREALSAWNSVFGRDPRKVIAGNFLAAEATERGASKETAFYESTAARYTPRDALFLWMIGLRLKEVGFNERANRYFNLAIQLDPRLKSRLPKS